MPLRNADATNFIGIDSSVQSSKKLSAAKRMSSRPSAIARRSQPTCFMSSGLCRRASLRPPEPALPAAQTRRVELPVDHHTERDQTNDYGRSDESVAQPDPGQSLRAGVIFRHRLQNDAPPEVSVNLDVPFVPAGIDRVAPALFLKQLENRAQQMVAISSLVAPKNPASQSATRFGFGR